MIFLLACPPHPVATEAVGPLEPTPVSVVAPASPLMPDIRPQVIQPNGLAWQVIREGYGDSPKAGDRVLLHYNAWLISGFLFDSTYKRDEAFLYTFGSGVVIPGFEEGIRTMKPGEIRVIRIPPELGYGDKGAGGLIPPGSTLIFEIELLLITS
jgi:FKBP-type peptidyl-prolyl cis-trans isomerase